MQQAARKEYFHTAPVLEVDLQIKQLLGQSDVGQSDADSSEDEDWELPTPNSVSPERVQAVEKDLHGPLRIHLHGSDFRNIRVRLSREMRVLT
jgi:hypothetical protein